MIPACNPNPWRRAAGIFKRARGFLASGLNETLSLYTRLPTLPGGCLAQAGGDRPCRPRV